MKIVIAPQALKGSLDAAAVGAAIAAGVARVAPVLAASFGSPVETVIIPIADGGEGTTRALVAATDGQLFTASVTGPLGDLVLAEYGLLGAVDAPDTLAEPTNAGQVAPQSEDGARPTAVIEMASAAGLPLIPLEQRDPLVASTRGVGELIRLALDAGCARIIVGLGGSATNDGGAGMAQALGARLLDTAGAELPPGGAALARLARIDIRRLDPRLLRTRILVACDVTNPLVGPAGASAVYGPQKGATPAMVAQLDDALTHYAEVIQRDLGLALAATPGGGAAGGLGAGLLAFTPAQLVPGASLVLTTLRFAERAQGADLVITAEGRLDEQTAYGKAVGAVAALAHAAGAPTIALVGALAADDATLAALKITVALPIADGPLNLAESMARAAELISATTTRALRLLALGAASKR